MDERAIEYLFASGSLPISIVKKGDALSLTSAAAVIGKPATLVTFWSPGAKALSIIRITMRRKVPGAQLDDVVRDLRTVAEVHGVRLTSYESAVRRAEQGAVTMDAWLDRLRTSGELKVFNSRYKELRLEAQSQGRGFMNFPDALSRLSKAIVARIAGNKPECPIAQLLDEVFGSSH